VIIGSRFGLLWIALAGVASSFKPRSGSTGDVAPEFGIKYSRPDPGHVNVTYHALRDHELLQLCVFLLKPKPPELVRCRAWAGYVPRRMPVG
jgi:hypothetical protein